MKRLLATAVVFLAFAAGCSRNTDTPDPAPTSVPPIVTTAPTQPSESPTQDTDEPNLPQTHKPGNDGTKAPTASPTPTNEEPPATQFLKRWGKKYPDVQEASIMQTAAKTCARIEGAKDNWQTNNAFIAAVKADMNSAGLADVSNATAADFAVDASQSVCSVVS
jgi:hypothetical protein